MHQFTLLVLILTGAATVGVGCSKAPKQDASASGKMAAGQDTLYHRLGGEDTIKRVVREFVRKSAANPQVNLTRRGHRQEWHPEPENVARFERRLVEFIASHTGGPRKYTGRDLAPSHAGMWISPVEFDAMVGELAATLDEFGVPQKEKDELLEIVGDTKNEIVRK